VAGQGTGSVVAIVWIACLSGVAVSVQAAVAHCLGHSFVVYVAGTLLLRSAFCRWHAGCNSGSDVGLRAGNLRNYCRVRFGLPRGPFFAHFNEGEL
jgi:hypothetical protein